MQHNKRNVRGEWLFGQVELPSATRRRREIPTTTMMPRTKTATPNRTTTSSRRSSENPTNSAAHRPVAARASMGRCPPQSPAPGFGEKYWSLSGFPSHSLES